ncbi:hypothetical protein Tco_1124262 [Tanacetum coccineum]|uniref:Uncharacterized protein n=1 Tax=Tanacetum coccineum TaxID=301880 RepID=A0ABQ5J8F7_9ASTR
MFENQLKLEINNDFYTCMKWIFLDLPPFCVNIETSNPTHNDIREYEWKMSYEECKKIYAKAIIFINKRRVRFIDVTMEQWLDLKYGNYKTMNKDFKKGVIDIRLIRSYKLQFEEYLEIKRQRETYAREVDMEYNPSNLVFAEWLTSKFYNHLEMDWYTMNTLWVYWMRGDDEVVLRNKEDSNLKDKNNNDEHEIAKVFRIETNLFDYETPLCVKFNEFNYLLNIDSKLFTYNIQRTKTYEDYENKLKNKDDEPWSEDGVPYEMCDHICEPFRFKNGKAKWPTCNSNEDGFYNRGELPGMVRVGYMTYFQDYEWYDELANGNLKEEALKQKSIYEKSWGDASQTVINFCAWLKRSFKNFHELNYELLANLQDYWRKLNDHECSLFSNWKDHIRGPYGNFITTYDPHLDIHGIFGMNSNASNNCDIQERKEQHKKRCNLFDDTAPNPPIYEIRRFEMIKYSFGQEE